MHHRLSSQMYRSSPGVTVSVSLNRIVDIITEFAGGDFAKLASSMCMKLIAEYVGLLGFIALALCLMKPSTRCGTRLPDPHQLKAKGRTVLVWVSDEDFRVFNLVTSNSSVCDVEMLNDWAHLEGKQGVMEIALRHTKQAQFLSRVYCFVPVPAASQPREVKALFRRSLRRKTVKGPRYRMARYVMPPVSQADPLETATLLAIAAVQQPAERATDCVVFLPGPEEVLDVHQQIQTRSS